MLPNAAAAVRKALQADLDFHVAAPRPRVARHPFPARFPPQLPGHFVDELSEPWDTVLDPMCGSGTTLHKAANMGRHVIGCDIDPLARLMASAQFASIEPLNLTICGRAVVEFARRRMATTSERAQLQTMLDKRFDAKTRAFVDYWFEPEQQLKLLALIDGVETGVPARHRPFLQMVFSSTIIAKSGGASLARDLAHTRPHRVLDKQPPCAFDEFEKRLNRMLPTRHVPIPDCIKHRLLPTAADATGLADDSVDLIVTSPPYANNAIDYMRAHKFTLVWLGWKIDDLTAIRSRCLGHDAKAKRDWSGLPGVCERIVGRLSDADERKGAALRRYFGEMSAVAAEMHRVLKPGKAAIVVVADSVLSGVEVATHKGLVAVGEAAGLQLAHIATRRIDRDKRMMPARWGGNNAAAQSQIERRMHQEHVLGFVKP